jgi:putative phosphoesterase
MDLELEGMQVRITHNIVSYEYYTFELFRQGKHPDLVVFGHTHKSIFETYRGITFLNPGSVYRPKGGTKKGVVVIAALKSDFEPRFISWD